MKIEAIDLFYLSMPEVLDEGDGSQDALIVRVVLGGHVGWGECEASPLVSIAAQVAPMSHSACHPVQDTVLGRRVERPSDIAAIGQDLALASMDLLQWPHTWSGIEMALWDALGKAQDMPAWRLLGWERAHPKTPYASMLFADDPQETLVRARAAAAGGFRAVKCGWGPYGRHGVEADADQVRAVREAIGPDGLLLVDAGQIFVEDVDAAAERLPALAAAGATWLEEPFLAHAYEAYGALAARSPVRLAGGEGSHNAHMARHLIEWGKVGFVQIDCGRVGGLGPAKSVADHARARGVDYVNHTFTSHLALAASLAPFVGLEEDRLCEYPVAPKAVALALSDRRLDRDSNGEVVLPDAPGLGVGASPDGMRPFLVDVEIRAKGRTLYATPAL